MHVIYACQAATEELNMAIEAAKQTRDAALLSKPIKRGRKVRSYWSYPTTNLLNLPTYSTYQPTLLTNLLNLPTYSTYATT